MAGGIGGVEAGVTAEQGAGDDCLLTGYHR